MFPSERLAGMARSGQRRRKGALGRLLTGIMTAVASVLLAVLLVAFLAALQMDWGSNAPTLAIRTLDTLGAAGGAAPPPPTPPTAQSNPTPQLSQPIPNLPRLQLDASNMNAPALKAQIDTKVDFQSMSNDFDVKQGLIGSDGSGTFADGIGSGGFGTHGMGRGHMTFMSAELDSQPRLVNRPSVTFPASQLRRGVKEGKVTLEVLINSAGRVTVKRVIASSHDDFTAMARSFATRARFTPPKKDGRPVNALFQWPLILRP